jgi:capsular exopolysaccharide synthesis family protein
MSKIFEALQRSVSERTGFPLSEAPDIATELLQETERLHCSVAAAAEFPLPTEPSIGPEWLQEQAKPEGLRSCAKLVPSLTPESRVIAITDPGSVAAERFRLLAVRLRNLRQRRELKRVLITSAVPDEGKSVVAVNLASTLARYKQLRILLVEGDIRRPRIRTSLGLPAMKGLSEWLRSDVPASEVIYEVNPPEVKFWLLPAGEPLAEPLELMQSGRLAALMENLSESFDLIIIDSTPILPVADTSFWARLSHGILMVVREGKTEKRQLKKALEAMEGSPLLGVVLNSCTNSEHKSYYTYYNGSQVETGSEQKK